VPLIVCLGCAPEDFNELSKGRQSGQSENGDASSAEPCADVSNDVENCGACGVRCKAIGTGMIACVNGECVEHSIELAAQSDGALHGNLTGGDSLTMQCAANEVLIGLRGKAANQTLSAVAMCGGLGLARASHGYVVSVTPTDTDFDVRAPNVSGFELHDYRLACPAGSVVRELSGKTTHFPEAKSNICVGALTLRCSTLRFDEQGELVMEDVGQASTDPSGGTMAFSEPCARDAVLSGINERYGAYLDAIGPHCNAIRLSQHPAAIETRDASPLP
jgi:hypothetical protein